MGGAAGNPLVDGSDSAEPESGVDAATGGGDATSVVADASEDVAARDSGTDGGPAPDGATTVGADGGGAPSFTTMWSGTAVAIPAQQLMTVVGTNTYRTYVRPLASGKHTWAFWISNGTDTTFGASGAAPNKPGGTWRIEAAYVADAGTTTHAGGVVAGTQKPVSFGGSASRNVLPGERFWSDPVSLDIPVDHDLAFTWSVSGGPYPYASVAFLTTYRAPGLSVADREAATGFAPMNDPVVAPQLFAYDQPVSNRLCFLGDSITQGVGSARNTYGYWVAKIATGLGPDVSVWNLGSGWARAADAASDGNWLYKAKQCAEVAVILGVNDFGSSARTSAQVLADLTTIVSKLKQNNALAKVILFTVPTFNFAGTNYDKWKQTNAALLATPPKGTDRVFDIAAVLSQPAPNDGLLKTEYRSTDAHPNDVAGTDIAKAFLTWYRK